MRAFLGLALAALATPVCGATVSIVSGGASATATDADGFLIVKDSEFPFHLDSVTEGRSVSARASLQSEGFDFSATAAGDIRSGSFRASAEKGVGFGEVLSGAGFAQEVTVRGNGQLALRMDLSGWWDTDASAALDDCCSVEFSSRIQFERPDGSFDTTQFVVSPVDADFQPDPDFRPSGEVSHSLTYAAMVADGVTYTLYGAVELVFNDSRFTSRVTGAAALDGIFSYAAGDGVRLEFADPEFLIAPIPLPAGWLLLASAIGAATILRRPHRNLTSARPPIG